MGHYLVTTGMRGGLARYQGDDGKAVSMVEERRTRSVDEGWKSVEVAEFVGSRLLSRK